MTPRRETRRNNRFQRPWRPPSSHLHPSRPARTDNSVCSCPTVSKETRDANAEGRPSYKDTLNLLQTSFGMRANAVKREPELQAFWADKGIDLKLGLDLSLIHI